MERKRDFSWLKNWQVRTLCGGCLFTGFLLGMLIFGSPWHLPPAWGDIPTWIGAIATAGLLIGAIITARYAMKAFEAQFEQLEEQRKINAKQIKVLELQTRDYRESFEERAREAEQRFKAQASRVYIETEIEPDPRISQAQRAAGHAAPETVTASVTNDSDQPIYFAEIVWDDDSLGYNEMIVWPGAERLAKVIQPGKTASRTKQAADTQCQRL